MQWGLIILRSLLLILLFSFTGFAEEYVGPWNRSHLPPALRAWPISCRFECECETPLAATGSPVAADPDKAEGVQFFQLKA